MKMIQILTNSPAGVEAIVMMTMTLEIASLFYRKAPYLMMGRLDVLTLLALLVRTLETHNHIACRRKVPRHERLQLKTPSDNSERFKVAKFELYTWLIMTFFFLST